MSGMRELAKAVGCSVATVSRALRRDPSVRKDTQKAVLKAAKTLGYEFNPYVGQMMSAMRKKQGEAMKGNLALIWQDYTPENHNLQLKKIQEGAHLRADELGYCLSEFVRAQYTPSSLWKIMRSRGIEGVMLSPSFSSQGKIHMHMPTEEFAWVSMGWALYHPAFHRVQFDQFQIIRLALHQAKKRFGHGIALLVDLSVDRRSDGSYRAAFLAHHPAGLSIANKLIFDLAKPDLGKIRKAFQEYNVKCLITQCEERLPKASNKWISPENIIYLDELHSPRCFGWLNSQYDLLGRWAVDILVATLQRNELGVPEVPKTLMIPPRWVPQRSS